MAARINRILVVRKMSALEYYYNGKHENPAIVESARNHDNNVVLIEKILKESGVEFRVVTRKELSEDLVSQYDAVISAGGDGTVIATAFFNKDKPQLNLKTDAKSVGALCQPDIENTLRKFLAGNYNIENWTRQDVYINDNLIGRASNETCVGEQLKFSKLARFNLTYKDKDNLRTENLSGSGLVITTGTGSTAWPAVFNAFPRDAQYLEFGVLLKHAGNINCGKSDSFLVDYKGHEGKIAIDTLEYDLPRDAKLRVELSKFPLKVILT